MNGPNAQVPTNSIEDSLQFAHQAAGRAESLLNAIWGDLVGENAADGTEASGGGALVYSAQSLNGRVQTIADRLESMRARIVSPKVTQLASAGQTQSGRAMGNY